MKIDERPHVIPNLLVRFKDALVTKVRPFQDKIDLTVVEGNIRTVQAYVVSLDDVPHTVGWMLANLAEGCEAIPGNGELQFQRFVPQPVKLNVHSEILSSDGVCLRYTVEPNAGLVPDVKITLECVVARGALVESPETD